MRPELPGVFLLGMAYGSTVCSLSCLPVLAPCLLATGRGFKDGIFLSLAFLQGKIVAYGFMGGLAAWLGTSLLRGAFLEPAIAGLVMIVVGGLLPFMKQGKCAKRCNRVGRRLPLFTLGMSTSFIPCPPLIVVLAAAGQQGNISGGIICGAVFGSGLMVSPLLLAAAGAAAIGSTVSMKSDSIIGVTRGLSALLVMGMGVRLILSV